MKTEKILASIVSNYNKLGAMAKANITKPEKNYEPVWGLIYKHKNVEGFVGQLGTIERGKTEIDIHNGQIQKIKKPFFSTWKKALKKVDNMLNDMTENFNKKETVQQTQVDILVFPKEVVKRIQEAQKRIYKK